MQESILEGSIQPQRMGLSVFDPLLCDFDAVILLRREALPEADLALLQPESSDGKRRRLLPGLLASAGFPGNKEDLVVPPKSARAQLRIIPRRECLL